MINLTDRLIWIFALAALGVAACSIDTESLPKIDTESFPKIGGTPNVSPTETSTGAATPVMATRSDPTANQTPAETPGVVATASNTPFLTAGEIQVQEKIAILRKASRRLAALAAEPAPIGLEELEAKEFSEYSKWLKLSSEQIDALIEKTEESRASNLMRSTKEMQEMNQSFNLQYLGLQQKMQSDNRHFTMVSNIMKEKHEKAREAINNVR